MDRFTCHPSRIVLKNGRVVTARPVRHGDRNLLVDLFHACSAETIYHRFLSPLSRLEGETLRRLVEVDFAREMALAILGDQGSEDVVLAVGRFRVVAGWPDTAELALIVGDPWQRQGIGRELLRLLTDVARQGGVAWYLSTIDPTNLRVVKFLEACGHRGRVRYEDGLLRMWSDVGALFPAEPVGPGERA